MRTKDDNHNMLRYWVGKYGIHDGLTEYFPELSAKDPVMRDALAMLRVAEVALRARVAELTQQAEDAEYGDA